MPWIRTPSMSYACRCRWHYVLSRHQPLWGLAGAGFCPREGGRWAKPCNLAALLEIGVNRLRGIYEGIRPSFAEAYLGHEEPLCWPTSCASDWRRSGSTQQYSKTWSASTLRQRSVHCSHTPGYVSDRPWDTHTRPGFRSPRPTREVGGGSLSKNLAQMVTHGAANFPAFLRVRVVRYLGVHFTPGEWPTSGAVSSTMGRPCWG